jgi:hypothetical protein
MVNDSQFQKAEIRVLRGKNKSQNKPYVKCRFNPPKYDIDRAVNYGEMKASGSGASSQQFVNRSADTLSMELFFDTSESQNDVREEYLDKLDYLASVDPELHAPPLCQFVWGDGLSFTALVDSLNKSFTRFLPSGVPVRASRKPAGNLRIVCACLVLGFLIFCASSKTTPNQST